MLRLRVLAIAAVIIVSAPHAQAVDTSANAVETDPVTVTGGSFPLADKLTIQTDQIRFSASAFWN